MRLTESRSSLNLACYSVPHDIWRADAVNETLDDVVTAILRAVAVSYASGRLVEFASGVRSLYEVSKDGAAATRMPKGVGVQDNDRKEEREIE